MLSPETSEKMVAHGFSLEGESTCDQVWGCEKWQKGNDRIVIHSAKDSVSPEQQIVSIYSLKYQNVLLSASDYQAINDRLAGLRKCAAPLRKGEVLNV